MDAKSIRNLLIYNFNVALDDIYLMNEIPADFTYETYREVPEIEGKHHAQLYGYLPTKGLVHISEIFANITKDEQINEVPLHKLHFITDFEFFVMKHWGVEDYSEPPYKHIKVYKAPNLKKFWIEHPELDIERFEEWLSK